MTLYLPDKITVGDLFWRSVPLPCPPFAMEDASRMVANHPVGNSYQKVTTATDSTIAPPPPQNQRFPSTNVSWRCSTRGTMLLLKKMSSCISLVAKDYTYFKCISNDGIQAAGGTVFQDNTAGSWFQNRRFRCRNVGEATVERLQHEKAYGRKESWGGSLTRARVTPGAAKKSPTKKGTSLSRLWSFEEN